MKRGTLAWWEDGLIALCVWLTALLFLIRGERDQTPRAHVPPRGW